MGCQVLVAAAAAGEGDDFLACCLDYLAGLVGLVVAAVGEAVGAGVEDEPAHHLAVGKCRLRWLLRSREPSDLPHHLERVHRPSQPVWQ